MSMFVKYGGLKVHGQLANGHHIVVKTSALKLQRGDLDPGSERTGGLGRPPGFPAEGSRGHSDQPWLASWRLRRCRHEPVSSDNFVISATPKVPDLQVNHWSLRPRSWLCCESSATQSGTKTNFDLTREPQVRSSCHEVPEC